MISISAVDASEVLITGPDAVKQWRDRHRLPVPGHEHMPLFKKGRWDGHKATGKWCKLRANGQYELRCSRGLVPRIVRDLGLDLRFDFVGLTEQEIDAWCATNDRYAMLRDYQQRAFRGVLLEGWARASFATNAGKGAVIGLLARFARDRKVPVLILCDEVAVFDALEGEIKEWGGFTPGTVERGMKHPPISVVTLAMIPTLARRLSSEEDDKGKRSGPWTDWVHSLRMVLVDEADKANAATWRSILDEAKNTTWRGGFSGTFPSELYADLRLDELMGPVSLIEAVTNKDMVERGVSAKPLIEVHGFDVTSALYPLTKDWYQTRGAGRRHLCFEKTVMLNTNRHAFIASLVRPETPTAVVVNRVEHGQLLTESIPGAVFLDGSVSDVERIRVLEDFRLGRVHVIVVTKILDRGTNRLGSAADLIFASGEGSSTQILQRIGRGLRRAGGKEFLRLVDVADRVQVTPTSDRRIKMAATFLHNAVRRRLQVYGQQGFDIEIHK